MTTSKQQRRIKELSLATGLLMDKGLLTDSIVSEFKQYVYGSEPKVIDVTSYALELGFDPQIVGEGTGLGKWVKSQIWPLGWQFKGSHKVNVYFKDAILFDVIMSYYDV